MAGLQRSSISFRRQGSSGIIWDDKLLSGELNHLMNKKEDNSNATTNTTAITASFTTTDDGGKAQLNKQSSLHEKEVKKELVVNVSTTIERSRSNGGGGRGFRTGKVSPPDVEPPSPKVSACGFCSAFGKHEKKKITRRRAKSAGKRKM